MADLHILQFMQLSPEKFPYVIKHDWWQHHPPEDADLRCDLEIWLSHHATHPPLEILKIRCFHAHYTQQDVVFPRFEQRLHLGVKSIRDRQWERYNYAFIDQVTGGELFTCASFEAWVLSDQ